MAGQSEVKGRIIKGVGGLYEVLCGDEIIACRARGVFRHGKISPAVGDIVTVALEPSGGGVIMSISERKNLLARPPIANLDHIFILIPTAEPPPDIIAADKLSSIATHNEIGVSVVVTKLELDRRSAKEIEDAYSRTPFKFFSVSALTGEGIDDLRSYILNELSMSLSAFAGASGVGKSTLMNALFPSLELDTGEVSRRTSRGRHTTRYVQLYPISQLVDNETGITSNVSAGLTAAESGAIADTPGFSLLDFVNYDYLTWEDLPYSFPEFEQYLGNCRYTKCSHIKEEGCAVLKALSDGEISPSRHKSFISIHEDIKDKREWDK